MDARNAGMGGDYPQGAPGDKLGEAREKAQGAGRQFREAATEAVEQGRTKMREMRHTIEDYVHDQPMRALLIAAGIGALIGILLRRR
jgi:ElaB/YqjD/DUF883 family membrane-anchored ribosome-binding protein